VIGTAVQQHLRRRHLQGGPHLAGRRHAGEKSGSYANEVNGDVLPPLALSSSVRAAVGVLSWATC
jgi:hypothetical protein